MAEFGKLNASDFINPITGEHIDPFLDKVGKGLSLDSIDPFNVGYGNYGDTPEGKEEWDREHNEFRKIEELETLNKQVYNKKEREEAIKDIDKQKIALAQGYQLYEGDKRILLINNLDDEGTFTRVESTLDKGKITYLGQKKITGDEADALMDKHQGDGEGPNTFCQFPVAMIGEKVYNAPNLEYQNGKEYDANQIEKNLETKVYDTETHSYEAVDYKTAEKYAANGGYAFVIGSGHLGLVTGGYSSNDNGEENKGNLNTYQAGESLPDYKRLRQGYEEKHLLTLKFYIWRKK